MPAIAMTDSVRIITSEGEFAALAEPWNALAADAVDGNTFLTHDWLYTWWTAYRPVARLRIVVVERGGQLIGIAPMMVMREGGAERIFRRLRFIGDGTSETDHMNFIVRAEGRQATVERLLESIDGMDWDLAYFTQVPEASENTQQLLAHGRQRGWIIDSRLVPCPKRLLPKTYEDLLRSLPSRLRTSIRSSRRSLEAEFKVEFGRVSQREDLGPALDDLYRLHASRWQAKGQSGVFVSEAKRNFYRDLSARLLKAGVLRLYYLKLDGRVVAQQYCFEHKGTVLLLQEGFDAALADRNVGNALRAMVFEALIADGAMAYDFLAGASRHKLAWADTLPNDMDVRAIRPSVAGRLAHFLITVRRRFAWPEGAASTVTMQPANSS
jgi:CelD/BcsL family acetyltransferase involved in cellulose biosynthesis